MHTRGKIAVTGATGRVGRHVVDVLEERGHDVVGISRSLGVDVVTGEGLAGALAGVETVVDTATGPSPRWTGLRPASPVDRLDLDGYQYFHSTRADICD